jgi:exodeoxyribonuclease VIII
MTELLLPDADGVLTPHPLGLVTCSNEAYHAGPGISKSKLDAIAISGLNYWDQYVNPEREPQEHKHCFAVGDGTHKLVLEPGTFEHTYAVGFDKSAYPHALDTAAELKAALTEHGLMISGTKPELASRLVNEGGFSRDKIMLFLEEAHNKSIAGKIEMPAKDYKNMMGMLSAIERHHSAGKLLKGAEVEQSFFWIDENGLLRKCRTDAIPTNGEFVVDLKTTDDVSKKGFGRTIDQRRYHVQGAWYLDILAGLYGRDAPRGFAFIAVQKTRPFDVTVQYLTRDQLALGRQLYQADLARLSECERLNYWPGVDKGELIEAELPAYSMNKLVYRY